MVKKLSVSLISTALLLIPIVPTFAESPMTVTAPVTGAMTRPLVQPTGNAMREEIKQTAQAEKVALKDKIQAAREAAKEAIAAQKSTFQTKLAAIKDEQKKTVVTNIDTRITTVNQARTDEMAGNLTILSTILDSISSKSVTAKAAGKTTTQLDADIAAARSALTLAQNVVTTQAAKNYTIQVTTELKLKPNVMSTLALFRKDLEAAHKAVVTARDGVRVAALDLENLNNPGLSSTPTASAAAKP